MSRHFSSVFVKLFGILLLAVLGINLAIILFLGAIRHHHITPALVPHIARYVEYLTAELGDPPDRARAEAIAARTNMTIFYESFAGSWATREGAVCPAREQLRHLTRIDDRIEMGSFHVSPVIFVQTSMGRLVFYLSGHIDLDYRIKVFGLILVCAVTLWLAGVYFLIRRILKPLRWLKTGVDQAARGELSHRVPEKGRDELGDLSRAFNTMTRRLDQLLKAKERLLLDVSHELRTPMTRVKVALAMLPDSDARTSILEDLAEMEAKIAELLDTARTISVKDELRRRPTDLADLIRTTAATFARRPPGIDIAEPEPLAPVRVDPVQMEKVLKNIMDNGLKYSRAQSPPLRISLSKQDNFALIAISDQGVGIPAEDLAFVFEPFYRVDPSRSPGTGGYGLGLSLAKTIVDAHDGRIEIQSKPGRGTTVRISLPLDVQEK
jgi:signal transduction histidine kinase